jgi:predicted NUDIX family phosphoesterase
MSGFSTAEQVLVVRRSDLFPADSAWHGLRTTDLDSYFDTISRLGFFLPRTQVEHDPAYQQIIPYVVFRHGDRYFVTQRTAAGSDARIHHLYSLGVGGHLNPVDGATDPLADGLRREWEEEVDYQGIFAPRLLGLLNDDSNPISSVHFGVIFLIEGSSDQISVRETTKLTGELLTLDELTALGADLEPWARLVLDHLQRLEAPDIH